LRPAGSDELGTRVEIKNLNSFRAMESAIRDQVARQSATLDAGGQVQQETLGWDDLNNTTFSQRSKEEAHDYRYFPEPDLPPLAVDDVWQARVRAALPELPHAQLQRVMTQYDLPETDARLLTEDAATAAYFDHLAAPQHGIAPRAAANWLLGEVFAWLHQTGGGMGSLPLTPAGPAELVRLQEDGPVNLPTAQRVLASMLESGRGAGEIIAQEGLSQVSDGELIAGLVHQVL
jgi:aspartyl-tRNA(Asn)/glutamyl-tRNA(Gln) amidotransferase subunit B